MPEITINTNGPLVISADDLVLKASDGTELDLPKGRAVALCRCGESAMKPYCDGSHKSCGFEHDPTA